MDGAQGWCSCDYGVCTSVFSELELAMRGVRVIDVWMPQRREGGEKMPEVVSDTSCEMIEKLSTTPSVPTGLVFSVSAWLACNRHLTVSDRDLPTPFAPRCLHSTAAAAAPDRAQTGLRCRAHHHTTLSYYTTLHCTAQAASTASSSSQCPTCSATASAGDTI